MKLCIRGPVCGDACLFLYLILFEDNFENFSPCQNLFLINRLLMSGTYYIVLIALSSTSHCCHALLSCQLLIIISTLRIRCILKQKDLRLN